MKYRRFGKLDWQVSALGFGAMRLPLRSANHRDIDETESIRMIRYAIDRGVNYVDTAYPYHEGRSEVVVGRALKDGYREKVRLATKMPTWAIASDQDFDRYLDEQLRRLDSGKVDFYLLHGLRQDRWCKLRELHVLRWAEHAMSAGRIGHLGFSFHDDFDVFKHIVDAYDNWAVSQIQYNYVDVDYQAGVRGLRYAAAKGLAVVIMEPLGGGRLTRRPPAKVAGLWEGAEAKRTLAERGLLWVWNHPEVSTVLSGMSSMQQVTENVGIADGAGPGVLTPAELALYDQARQAFREESPVPCTDCRYCMPCPHGVEIPRILRMYNDAIVYDDTPAYQGFYHWIAEQHRADKCVRCGECEEACPQNICVPKWLAKAQELLDPAASNPAKPSHGTQDLA